MVRRYLDAHPDVARVLDDYVRALDAEDVRPQPPDATASFAALRLRLDAEERDAVVPGEAHVRPAPAGTAGGSSTMPRRRGARSTGWRRAIGTAAMIAAAGVATVYLVETRRASVAATPHMYATADGERADITLKDGTRVHLAPRSHFRVGAEFGRARRDVYLDGQAYFEVRHDARHPFTVYAGRTAARDLGTAFAVRSFAEDNAVEVIVRAGAVAMTGVGRLGAGDVGRLDADGTVSRTRGADVDALLGWVDGRLQFSDATLGRVLADARRWYGVDVVLADSSLAALPFTGVLSDLSPARAIDLVAATLGLRVQPEGERFVLYPIPGRTPRPPDVTRKVH